MKISRVRAALLLGAGVLTAGAVSAATTSTTDPNVTPVDALAVDTLIFEHRMGLPDDATHAVVAPAEADHLRESAIASVNARYKGRLLATRSEQMLAAVNDRINGTSSVIDGGASDVVFLHTTVTPTSATVVLRATTWATYSQNGVLAHPVSTDNWTFDFEKDAGRWYVVNVETDFHG